MLKSRETFIALFEEFKAKRAGNSLRNFARRTQLSPSYISRIVNGARPVTTLVVLKIADALLLSVEKKQEFMNQVLAEAGIVEAEVKKSTEVQTEKSHAFEILNAVVIFAFLMITSCGVFTKSTAKEIAINGSSDKFFLYVGEETNIARFQCPDRQVISKHSCTGEQKRVPRAKFTQILSLGMDKKISQLEANIEDLYIKIQNIDMKLQELFAVPSASPEIEGLKAKMNAQEKLVASVKLNLIYLDGQIASITERLNAGPNPDLEKQLGTLVNEHKHTFASYTESHQKLMEIREEYIQACSKLANNNVTSGLVAMNKNLQDQLNRKKKDLDEELANTASLQQTVAMLDDHEFVFDMRESVAEFEPNMQHIRRFNEIFESLFEKPSSVRNIFVALEQSPTKSEDTFFLYFSAVQSTQMQYCIGTKTECEDQSHWQKASFLRTSGERQIYQSSSPVGLSHELELYVQALNPAKNLEQKEKIIVQHK